MWNKQLHWLPLVTLTCFILNFTVVYIMAVSFEHVEIFWPYISTTGNTPPESCVFTELLFISALLTCFCVYIRFRHIEAHLNASTSVSNTHHSASTDSSSETRAAIAGGSAENLPRLEITQRRNCCSIRVLRIVLYAEGFLGLVTVIGLTIVGSFQEKSLLSVHLTGAFCSFVGGLMYCTLDTFLTIKMKQLGLCLHVGNCVSGLRVAITIFGSAFLISTDCLRRKRDELKTTPSGHIGGLRKRLGIPLGASISGKRPINRFPFSSQIEIANVGGALCAHSFTSLLSATKSLHAAYGDNSLETTVTTTGTTDEPSLLHFLIWYKFYANQYATEWRLLHMRDGAIILSELAVNKIDLNKPRVPYLVSTISEWLMALSLVSYFATLVFEFRLFALDAPDAILYAARGASRERNVEPGSDEFSPTTDDRSNLLRSDSITNSARQRVGRENQRGLLHDVKCSCTKCRFTGLRNQSTLQ